VIQVLLLLGLPASGKSEIRRYLGSLGRRERAALGVGDLVHLDDYPYVHLMRRISQELRETGADPIFFATDAASMSDPGDWLTLIHLLNEDFARLQGLGSAPALLLDRFDRARAAAGLPAPFASLPSARRSALEAALVPGALSTLPTAPPGSTVVIEFSRGAGPGARPPFPPPWGYAASLGALAPAILERAALLYVWVTPAESRRRNRDRARPGADGSTLHHGVPDEVMRRDYSGDDLAWLLRHSAQLGHVTVAAAGRRYQVPARRFDNRVDRTSFLRNDPATWPAARLTDLHRRLSAVMTPLAQPR
jgi:hypothetical protein